MAKAKKRNYIPLYEDYFDQINLLSFEQAGRLFALIRAYSSLDALAFQAYEASITLETGAQILWSFIKTELQAFFEAKKQKSETNAANARKRWGTAAADIPGQRSFVYTAEQADAGCEPELTVHAAGMQTNANGMRNDAFASKNDAIASPIYNINNNNIHNNNIDISESDQDNLFESPDLEMVIQLFTDNGSTKAAAEKYYKYYQIRGWKTAKGELITNLEESVKRWIARDLNFWRKRRSKTNVHPVTDQSEHKAVYAASNTNTYWDGTCSRPSNEKPNSLRNYEQRNYDYDALQKVLCAI